MANTKNDDALFNGAATSRVRSLTYGSLMIALVFISTFAIRIPIPFTQGYIHPGDSMVFVAALLFGWRFGALAGGLGSALADILGGYAHWALPTLIIKGVMGGLVGWIGHDLPAKENHRQINTLLTSGVTAAWIAFCYGVKTILANSLLKEPASLLKQMPEAGTLEGLYSLAEGVDFWLIVAALAVPLGIISLAYYLKKLGLDFFNAAQLMGMFLAGLWMIVGYYLAAGFLYGSFVVSIFSIPSNIIQFLGGLGIAYLVLIPLRKTNLF